MTSQCIKMNRNKLIESDVNAEHHLWQRTTNHAEAFSFVRSLINLSDE